MNAPQQTSVAAQVAALPTLPMKELWALWDRYYPGRPSKTNREYLEARIAYKLQEEVYGGLKPETRERLIQIGRAHSKIRTIRKTQTFHFAPGTVLVREWGERDHSSCRNSGSICSRVPSSPRCSEISSTRERPTAMAATRPN